MSVARLSDRVRRELTYLSYPSREWTVPRYRDGTRVLDVLIVGGGQGGLATAFGLKRERITNIRIVDRNPPRARGTLAPICPHDGATHLQGRDGHRPRHPEPYPPCLVRGEIRPPSMGAHQTAFPRRYGGNISIGTAMFWSFRSKTRSK